MAYKSREEIVGKRFLSVVSGFAKLKLGKISEWGWRAGVIRAATHKDNTNKDLQVLVEYDDVEWHRREWISIYKDGLFHLFMVEQGLYWAERTDPFAHSKSTVLWPALTFTPLVSTVDLSNHLQPVEFLLDRELSFADYKLLKPFQEWDSSLPGVREYPELRSAVRRWGEQQDGQRILLATPSVLVGYRVEVYRAEGTTQWYTAVIVGYNEATRDLTVTDDTVLEEHNEDPALVQMRLIGDGVVESIMRGENVGITPRRSRSAVLQTQHQQQPSRVVRGLSSVNASSTVSTRKPRTGKPSIVAESILQTSAEPPDKGLNTKGTRKRKTSENETLAKLKTNASFCNIKEDLENKQGRKRNVVSRGSNKKKVLEEANNSKLRDLQVRVEDCLQNAACSEVLSAVCRRAFEESTQEEVASTDQETTSSNEPTTSPEPIDTNTAALQTEQPGGVENDSTLDDSSNGSSVQLVPVEIRDCDDNDGSREDSVPVPEQVVTEIVSEEDDCVIVAQRTTPKLEERECSSRGDDDGPLSSSSPFSRMELAESASAAALLRFPDDRSDSGVSSLRSGSGDERSGSRSSALSSSDEPQNSTTNQNQPTNRSPLFIPSSLPYSSAPASSSSGSVSEPVRVWRDPSLLLESEPHVRHIHSVQHQSLLMSHPSAPAASGPPPTSAAAASHPASLYPPVPPPPTLMSPHPLQHHPHLPPPALYPHPISDMLWKQRYSLPVGAHLLAPQAPAHPAAEELLDRERAYAQDRDRHERLLRERQNQETREIEKQKEREKERERQERDKHDREREREKHEREQEQERERQEKQRTQQAVQKHFEESLKRAQQKQQGGWNLISMPPPNRNNEEERKRAEQEHHQREQQQRHMSNSSQSRSDVRDRSYYSASTQRSMSMASKADYPPPAHSRVPTTKSSEKMSSVHPSMSKAEVNVFGYPAYQPTSFFQHEPKSKSSEHHKLSTQNSGLVVTKSGSSVDRDGRDMLPNPPPLINELKNSVIVKHDGKNPHHMESRVSVAHSPKLRSDMIGHYLTSPGQSHKGNLYEYRSPTQSPHHLSHTPSPHHLQQPENLGKHHRTSQLPSPHHQRQSPHAHPHSQPHPSPELRYRSNSESQAMLYQQSAKGGNIPSSYPYITQPSSVSPYTVAASSVSNSKPKVSSPAPHHIYGKPSAGLGSGLPTTRSHEPTSVGNPIPLTSKPPLSSSVSPSPYQQVSQYHLPHPQSQQQMPTALPPPAHSSRASSATMFDRMYPGSAVPGGLAVKPSVQHGTSPPTAASAPSPIARSHPQYLPGVTLPSQNIPSGHSVQTQPLDLGVSSNKYDSSSPKRKGTPVNNLPVCLEVKKRRIDSQTPPSSQPNLSVYSGQPQLARVSEPSPLIASAATTITTVVNTAAFRGTSLTPSQSPSILTDVLPDVSVMTVNVPNERPPSLDSNASVASTASTAVSIPQSVPSTTSTTATVSEPTTPIKTSTVTVTTPSTVDSEKSNSPVPLKGSTNYPVRHLKKAWLQRHTGEDTDTDTTGIIGSGSCVTLPLNITSSLPIKETPPVSSLHNIGSMAVNSINKSKPFQSKSNNRKGHKETTSLNGHPVDGNKDDSSSSDQERGGKSPPKRKPPKVKRKKGGGVSKKTSEDHKKRKVGSQTAAVSESGSDSDKESISDKDSDSGASSTVSGKKSSNNSTAPKDKEPRKRGRRPKTKNDKGEEPRPKKSKDELVPQRDPFRKPPVGQLKKTGESFLQDGPCFEVAPKLAKCRECRWTPNQRSKNMPNIFCRFYAFRRLRYTKNGQLAIAGFSDPHKDALEDDLKLWLPAPETPPSDLDLETSRFILKQVGDHFCNLLLQEKEAHNEHMSEDKVIAWKRVVQGVREMCDVCETTLFNFHWACGKCGFVVCLDCYKGRKSGSIKIWGEPGKDRDDFSWLLCTNRQAHEQEKLMLTQIIAGDSLQKLGRLVHEMRELWNVEQLCGCPISKEVTQKSNGARKEIIKSILSGELNGVKKEIKEDPDSKSSVNGEEKKNDDSSDSDESSFSTLRELLIRPSHKPNGSRAASPVPNPSKNKKNTRLDTLDEVISSVIEDSVPKGEAPVDSKELKHFVPRDNALAKTKGMLPIRIMTLTESKILYPDTPHTWLCDGKLLRLSDSKHTGNNKIFQDQWKRGQPVLVSDVSRYLDKDLWSPEAFARDFGDEKNDLVNCINGSVVVNQPMRKFWEGFEHFSKRLKDERGNPMLLKLKDWPPGEDFAEMLPTRFADLMKVLPLSEYTHRNGRLNLASRLPDCFVRPDLGPKMYNAYGSALHPSKGTTNLHLDISDAVNVMVYVGIPKDSDTDEHIKEAFRAIDEAGCDILTRRRVRDKGELPGALWHIYNARDADKIRDLLNKVVVEKGGILKPNHDPIHDQSCYLDGALRERLYKEYGVEGYAIVQCLGDAVFIPAGAPHQVRNLHNCIKVAEDFVSPENVSHCFHLTQEFRDLSDTHSNHEDKLQIKNIIFHAVKDSLSTLTSILNKHIKTEKDATARNGNNSGATGVTDIQISTMDSSEPA